MNCFIGYSTDSQVRFKASSGGVGSAIVKYLLDNKICDCALNFEWDRNRLCYQPTLITDFSQYNICGSIYQEIKLVSWLKEMLSKHPSNGKIVLFCLPCQTKALRKVCESAGFKSIIIGLTCSSQQSKEATSYLLHKIGVKEQDVKHLQYRGNGWPSGIQIETNDGKFYFVKNSGSVWTEIFHSRLFIYPRCYSCRNTLNDNADIALADPWLKEYINKETIGQTLFTTYTQEGEKIINECAKAGYINLQEVDKGLLYKSQKSTIIRKTAYNNHPKLRNWMRKLFLSNNYKLLAKKKRLFRLHCMLKARVEHLITRV